MTPQRILWYFADPMCSWCWGFAPVISAIETTFRDRLRLSLVMGGLRPGTEGPVTPAFREKILRHWREVQERSAQPFKFENALPDGFVYNTEPACRAVVAVHGLNRAQTFPYFRSVQAAFYAEGQDVTQAQTLARLAQAYRIDPELFLERFFSSDTKEMTQAHFRQTAEVGVSGFPMVLLQNGARFALLAHGYVPFEKLEPAINAWLAEA